MRECLQFIELLYACSREDAIAASLGVAREPPHAVVAHGGRSSHSRVYRERRRHARMHVRAYGAGHCSPGDGRGSRSSEPRPHAAATSSRLQLNGGELFRFSGIFRRRHRIGSGGVGVVT